MEMQNAKTVLSGAIGLAAIDLSKSEILHRAASNLNIDGFRINQIRVFEDPLSAHVEIENQLVQRGALAKLVHSANKAFAHIDARFLVSLTVTDFTDPHEGLEITYSIKRLKKSRYKLVDETSIDIAHKVKARLISGVKHTGAPLFTTIPAA